MRIVSKKGEFDLPIDFEVEITVSNPFLSEMGEQSVPFSLPITDNNLSLLGYSHRLAASYKPLKSLNVQIMSGVMCRACRMQINSIDKMINVSLYFNDSEFYSKIENLKLSDIPWLTISIEDYDNKTYDERVWYLIDLLKDIYKNPLSANYSNMFSIVPVATTQEQKDKTGYPEDGTPGIVFNPLKNFNKLILNDFRRYPFTAFTLEDNGWGGSSLVVSGFQTDLDRKLEISSNRITVKSGYGMTPFLKVDYVITEIFQFFGYNFYSSFSQNDIILNNVVDAILDGKLYVSQLLPNMTIKEFLSKIEDLYGVRFLLNEVDKSVSAVHIYSSFREATKDFTSYVYGKPIKKQPHFQQLEIQRNNRMNPIESHRVLNPKKQISIDVLTEKVEVKQKYVEGILTYSLQQINDVVHLNSVKIENGKTVKEEQKSMSELRICGVEIGCQYPTMVANKILRWNLSVPSSMEQSVMFSQTDRLDLVYQEYAKFLLNSNVAVSVNMMLPKSKLLTLDITEPILLFGQKMLFEKIVYSSDVNDNLCKVVLRTCQPYKDREM